VHSQLIARAAGAILAIFAANLAVGAQQAGDDVPELTVEQRLDAQQQQILVLQRKLEMADEAAASTAASAPQVRATANRFSLGSADGGNFIRLRGVLHADGRFVNGGATPATADTFLLRRVRPTIEGTFGNTFDFRFTPDFAGGRTIILDAYATARFTPWAALQVGKFKVPVGLERMQSAADIRFIERAFPTSLLPNRDVGAQITGELSGGAVSYSIGYFNGVTDGGSSDGGTPADAETDTAGDWAARVFLQPFLNSNHIGLRGLGFGVGATYVDVAGNSGLPQLASYRTPGQQTFFSWRSNNAATGVASNATYADGRRLRMTPQFHYYRGRLGVLGEYAEVSQDVARTVGGATRTDRLKNSAWHAQLSWFLTGEEESFRGFTPGTTYQVGKPGWGAFEVVARVHQLDIDNDAFAGGGSSFANPATAASKATAWGAGVNWYPHNAVKLSLNYDRTRFDGGAVGGDRGDEHAVLTRLAVNF
jgi:phosphate-selective porin OprO/OprP